MNFNFKDLHLLFFSPSIEWVWILNKSCDSIDTNNKVKCSQHRTLEKGLKQNEDEEEEEEAALRLIKFNFKGKTIIKTKTLWVIENL